MQGPRAKANDMHYQGHLLATIVYHQPQPLQMLEKTMGAHQGDQVVVCLGAVEVAPG